MFQAIFNKEYYDKGDEDEEKPCFSEMSDMSEEEGVTVIKITVFSIFVENALNFSLTVTRRFVHLQPMKSRVC